MTSASSIQAKIRTTPPQAKQVSTPMPQTPFQAIRRGSCGPIMGHLYPDPNGSLSEIPTLRRWVVARSKWFRFGSENDSTIESGTF